MNIFEDYKNKLLKIIKNAEKANLIILPDNLDSINVDSTPPNINFDFICYKFLKIRNFKSF